MQFDALSEAGMREEHIYVEQFSGTKSARGRPAASKLPGYNASGCPQRRHRFGDRMQPVRGDRLVGQLRLAGGS